MSCCTPPRFIRGKADLRGLEESNFGSQLQADREGRCGPVDTHVQPATVRSMPSIRLPDYATGNFHALRRGHGARGEAEYYRDVRCPARARSADRPSAMRHRGPGPVRANRRGRSWEQPDLRARRRKNRDAEVRLYPGGEIRARPAHGHVAFRHGHSATAAAEVRREHDQPGGGRTATRFDPALRFEGRAGGVIRFPRQNYRLSAAVESTI